MTDLQDGIQVTLSAIPAQYEPNGELTLFNHMEFDVSCTMPMPDVSIDNVLVNSGQPVGINQARLPLSVTVTTPQAQSLKLQLEIVDPSGRTVGSASQIAPLLAGSNEISLELDSGGWTPGPKTLWISIGDEDAVLDSLVLSFSALGVRIEASVADPFVGPGVMVPLALTVRDENGTLVSGLADRIAVTVDGTSVQPTVTEEAAGTYRADLTTTGLGLGMHQVGVQVTDLRDISGKGIVEFTIRFRKVWLPLIMR